MIVWLASYPRSGNTFLRMLLLRLYGRTSVNLYPSSGSKLFAPATLTREEMAVSPEHHFVKTHDLPGEDRHPAIYIIRDGRDSLVSYTWYALLRHYEVPREEIDTALFTRTMRDLIMDERSPFGTWSKSVAAWSRRKGTATVRFEALITEPAACLAAALDQLGLDLTPLPDGEVPSFEELQSLSASFRRGVVGSWKDEFPPDLLDLFWRKHGKVMRRLGYD